FIFLRCAKPKAISRVLVGVWLSPVEHCVRDAGVAGSNPATPTILSITYNFDVPATQRNELPVRVLAADLGVIPHFRTPDGRSGRRCV
ncbi:MAG: uncharacterized protein JWP08_3046, partial [Bryobacterales bacterium]|nr:uncharacterized protein [Bryobacterales bacterium]